MTTRKTHKKRNSSRTRKYSAHTLPVLKQSFDEIEHEASIILKEIDNPKDEKVVNVVPAIGECLTDRTSGRHMVLLDEQGAH